MMKYILPLLLFISSLAHGQIANEVRIQQRDPTNTFYAMRTFGAPPASNAPYILGFNGSTVLPQQFLLGDALTFDGTNLDVVYGSGLTLSSGALVVDTSTVASTSALTSGLATKQDALSGSGFVKISGTTISYDTSTYLTAEVDGSVTNEIELPTQTGQAGKVLTTNGSVPSWTTASAGTVTSVTAGTGLSGGTITGSGTISLPNTGTAGTYSGITTDAQGRVTAGTTRSFASPSRSVVTSTSSTGYQISSTRDAFVSYEGTFSTTSTIGGPASITIFLETADTNSTNPADWTIIARQVNSNTITLAVVLQQVDIEPWSVSRMIPAGKYVRIRSGSVTGTATAAINAEQQEVLQ